MAILMEIMGLFQELLRFRSLGLPTYTVYCRVRAQALEKLKIERDPYSKIATRLDKTREHGASYTCLDTMRHACYKPSTVLSNLEF